MAKGKPQKKHTDSEKEQIVNNICQNYLSGNTIESCCENESIAKSNFYNWINENGLLRQIYQKTRNQIERNFKDRLRQKALSSLEKMIDVFEYEEVHTEGKLIDTGKTDDKGNKVEKLKVTRQTKTKKTVLPNPMLVMYALNNSNDFDNTEFVHASKIDSTVKGEINHMGQINVIISPPSVNPIGDENEMRKRHGL